MRCLVITISFLLVIPPAGLAQQQRKAESESEHDVKMCTPKVTHRKPLSKAKPITVHKGDKSTGYSPLIAFEILESGEVANAHVRRSSGFADIDTYALNWVRTIRYNSRPGCGTIETEAAVSVDFFSP